MTSNFSSQIMLPPRLQLCQISRRKRKQSREDVCRQVGAEHAFRLFLWLKDSFGEKD